MVIRRRKRQERPKTSGMPKNWAGFLNYLQRISAEPFWTALQCKPTHHFCSLKSALMMFQSHFFWHLPLPEVWRTRDQHTPAPRGHAVKPSESPPEEGECWVRRPGPQDPPSAWGDTVRGRLHSLWPFPDVCASHLRFLIQGKHPIHLPKYHRNQLGAEVLQPWSSSLPASSHHLVWGLWFRGYSERFRWKRLHEVFAHTAPLPTLAPSRTGIF